MFPAWLVLPSSLSLSVLVASCVFCITMIIAFLKEKKNNCFLTPSQCATPWRGEFISEVEWMDQTSEVWSLAWFSIDVNTIHQTKWNHRSNKLLSYILDTPPPSNVPHPCPLNGLTFSLVTFLK